jgi:hypothetical protein
LGEAHLVHGAVDMDQLHAVAASADFMQLAVLVLFDEGGLFSV